MANYTVKNLKDVENMAEQFGMSDGLEARFAKGPLELSNFGLSYQRLEPNFRIPFGHKHGEQEEVYVVLSGSARLKLDDEIVDLKQWDAIRVPGEVTRNFEGGPAGAELLAIGAPLAKDTEMLQGWWSD
jgi:mannose-6-phosphate isomerase-like protein (cupin superfamily)